MDRENIAKASKKLYSNENMCREYLAEYDYDGKKNRILLIDVNCKNSSTGEIVYNLYQSIRHDNREAAICYGRGPLIKEENVFKFGLDWETKMHAALARTTGYNGYFSQLSTRRLIKFIDKYNPDLIHIHELHAYFVNIKTLLKYIKKRNISVIWTFHCEYMYTGKCGHAYECARFMNGCGNCPSVNEYPKSFWYDKTKQMLEMKKCLLNDWDFFIITPSKWLSDRVRLSFLKNKRIKVIHNGIDTDVFKPVDAYDIRERLKIPDNNRIALFVAPTVMDRRKGGQWVERIAERMQGERIIFILVGGGKIPDNIPHNMRFVGPVNDKNLLAKYYSVADVFLLCSEKETYSMTCAEALCCGTAVIGFKSGAPETVFEEPYARFVEYGDLEGMVKAINEIVEI